MSKSKQPINSKSGGVSQSAFEGVSDSVSENVFGALRHDFHDDGFTAEVMARLPQRGSIMPQIIVAVFAMLGVVATLALVGIDAILGRVLDFVAALSRLQLPSALSVVAFFFKKKTMGCIGWAVFQAEE